jgi:hypothetical protein
MGKVKHILIELEERNGEQEYRQFALRTIGSRVKNYNKIGDKIAKEWYASFKPEKYDNGYFHLGGTIFVEVKTIQDITEQEYKTLSKFI